jgi:hypothetical protein
VTDVRRKDDLFDITISDGFHAVGRAVVVASGARYKGLPVDRWKDFEGAGIFYAAPDLEARLCTGSSSSARTSWLEGTVLIGNQITALHGDDFSGPVTISHRATGTIRPQLPWET